MPTLDTVFNALVTGQTVLFCLGIGVITYFLRTLVEGLWKGAKTSLYWNEIALPLGPIGTGWLLVMLSRSFQLPVPIMGSVMAKLFYGGLCGMCSGWVFGRFRSFMTAAADSNAPIAPLAQKMLHRPTSIPPKAKSDPPPAPPV